MTSHVTFQLEPVSINNTNPTPCMSIVHKYIVQFGSILVSFSRTPRGPGITNKRPHYLHRDSCADAWMDEESGNIIHRPHAFTGTEKYS